MNTYNFFKMNQKQQFWYAKVMIAIVLADENVDPAEKHYLELIARLFAGSDLLTQLTQMTRNEATIDLEPPVEFTQEMARAIIQDCVDVSIADHEFHEEERKLIGHLGKLLQLPWKEVEEEIIRGQYQLAHIFNFHERELAS